MKRNNIYQEVTTYSSTENIVVGQVKNILAREGVLDTDYVEMDTEYTEANFKNPYKYSIEVWRHREETNEEYEKRLADAEKCKRTYESVMSMADVTTVEHRRKLYEELKKEFEQPEESK